MGNIIRMVDPESVREVGRMLGRTADKILDVQTEVSRAAGGMDWDGSGKDYFLQDVEIWAGKMYGLAQRYGEKGPAVIKEADEWENAAKKFGWGAEGYTPFLVGDRDDTTAVDESDIHQGGINDCYFMSSIGAIALQHPELIEKMIHDNGDGTYTVTFYDAHCLTPFGPCTYTPHEVTVDGNPWDRSSSPGDTIGGTEESWTIILEKAYHKWKEERFLSDPLSVLPTPAVALSAMTGKDSVNYPTSLMSIDTLYESFQRGDAITAGGKWTQDPTRPVDKMFGANDIVGFDTEKIREGHVYFITGVDPVNNTVTVQNPWGPEWEPITMSFEDYQDCFWLTTTNPVD
jgi:hypothetical protein